jgi:hypothetical protein
MEGEDEFARQALVRNCSEHQAFSLKRPGIGAETALRAKVLPTITVLHNHAIGFDCVGSFTDIAHAIWVIVRCHSIISIAPQDEIPASWLHLECYAWVVCRSDVFRRDCHGICSDDG